MIKNLRITRYIYATFFGIVLIALLYIFYAYSGYAEGKFVLDDENMAEWNEGWEINYDGIIEDNVTLPASVPVKQGNSVIICKNLPDKIKQYNCLMLEGKRQDIIVSIGGIQRTAFSNEGHRPFGKTSPSGIILVPLYNTDSQSDVAIRISSDSVFSGEIGSVYIGSEKSFMFKILKANLLWIALTAVVCIIGIICAMSYVTYGPDFDISKAMGYLAVFAITSAVWSFSQSGLRQVIFNDLATLEAVGYCCYMIIPIPALLYSNWIMKRKYEPIVIVCSVVCVCNFIIENIVQAIFKISFFEMSIIAQITLSAVAIVLLVLCIREIKNESVNMTRTLLVGIMGLIFGIIMSLTLGGNSTRWGVFDNSILGAFVFVLSGYIYTSMYIRREQTAKKDAESANLAKSLFLASMSHEIKTPINVVMGMNEMILRDAKDEVILEYANKIDDAGRTLVTIVNDVLDFSKIEDGKMDIICVDYKIKSMIKDLIVMTEVRSKEKGLKLLLDIDESIPAGCYGDEIRIKQVVTNLLTNAVKYTPSGSVTFIVKNLGIQNGEVDLYFAIKDTGVGIKEEDISRFMDSFVRIDQVKNSNIGGTGLGLTITSQLLMLMGSKLEVNSVYGEGSEFFFTIKQKVTDMTAMGPIREKEEKKAKKKVKVTFTAPEARVLVVDDNKMNITVVKGLLKTTKMKIDSAESGKKCLELCKDNYYDLIIMDHMMPEMDGIETFKQLKADKSLKSTESDVIVLTANTVSGASEMYSEVGFKYYLKKPVDVVELNEVAQMFIPKEMIFPLETSE